MTNTIAQADNKHMRHLLGIAILEKLEPEALLVCTGNVPDTLLSSLAISMKRIADLLGEIETKPGVDHEVHSEMK